MMRRCKIMCTLHSKKPTMSTNRILSILFGSTKADEKRKALEALNARFKRATGHSLHPNNVALVTRAKTDTPFVLSLSLDGGRAMDLYAQGLDIDISTQDNLPTVKIGFSPAVVINVGNPMQIKDLMALWFEAFKTSHGHMSAVAASQGKSLTAVSRRGVAWPGRQLMQASVHSVKIEMGVGAIVVTVDVELADVFGTALKALAAIKKDPTIVKRTSAGRYQISRQIPLTAEHGACVAFLGGDASSRDACVKSINTLWLILSRSGLDPVVLKALGRANLGSGARSEAELQIRTDTGELYDRQVIRFNPSTKTTVAKTAALVKKAQAGKLDILGAIEAVGRAWKAHAPK